MSIEHPNRLRDFQISKSSNNFNEISDVSEPCAQGQQRRPLPPSFMAMWLHIGLNMSPLGVLSNPMGNTVGILPAPCANMNEVSAYLLGILSAHSLILDGPRLLKQNRRTQWNLFSNMLKQCWMRVRFCENCLTILESSKSLRTFWKLMEISSNMWNLQGNL